MYKRVRDNETLVKDFTSGAVLSTDAEALRARRAARERVKQAADDHQRIVELEERVHKLEALINRMVIHNG